MNPTESIQQVKKEVRELVNLDLVMSVAFMLEKGERSTFAIMSATGLKRDAAIKYRNAAMHLISEESKPMNREHMRNLEIGRLHYWIEKIQKLIHSAKDTDTKVKLLGRLNDFQGRLHAITGMNTEVNVHVSEKRRIVFIRPNTSEHNDIHKSNIQSDQTEDLNINKNGIGGSESQEYLTPSTI